MPRRLMIPLALIGALLLAATASAAGRDRNHDRIPDRWERHHDLSLHVKQTHRDQDHDGLENLAEWRSHTDPRDRDSDDDGVRDDDENAGKVVSFEDGVLTIAVFAGGEVSGRVTDATRIECEDEHHASADGDGDGGHSGPGGGDDHDDDDACPAGALVRGAVVEEAELEITSAGRIWEEVEL